MEQNHLGKYLKLSSINSPTIEYQLFNFAKESLKQIFLNSKCGEIINGKEFKDKPASSDLLGSKTIYPLCCLYKKAKPKIKIENNIYSWKEKNIKKKIDILSNSYMTLSLLTLADYYNQIIKNEKKRKEVVRFYVSSAKCQLNYYLKNFRNELGLFVNKDFVEKNDSNQVTFQSTNNNFDFSAQAYLMICFNKCSEMLKDESPYKLPFYNFSKEMEKMFIDFKEDIFNQSSKNIINLLNALQIYLNLNNQYNEELLDIILTLISNFFKNNSISSIGTYDKLSFYKTLSYIKSYLSENLNNTFYNLNHYISEYLWELEEFLLNNNFELNELTNAEDLISYQIYILNDKQKALNFYNSILLPSKIFSCFPNIPKSHESEKYFNFDHKDQYKIPDILFKPTCYKSMNDTNLTPIIDKYISYSYEKNKFSNPKYKFNSLTNMKLIFLLLTSLQNIIINSTK